jgi:hypothetical protein
MDDLNIWAGFKFHQYQQNKQPPLISNHRTQKGQRYVVLDIQILVGTSTKMWLV